MLIRYENIPAIPGLFAIHRRIGGGRGDVDWVGDSPYPRIHNVASKTLPDALSTLLQMNWSNNNRGKFKMNLRYEWDGGYLGTLEVLYDNGIEKNES